jgi:hypothetical protein
MRKTSRSTMDKQGAHSRAHAMRLAQKILEQSFPSRHRDFVLGTGRVLEPGEGVRDSSADRVSGSGLSIAQRLTPLEGIKLGSLMEYLWARVGGVLVFPDELMNFGFHGRVHVDVLIDAQGRIEGEPQVQAADNRYLKVAVVRSLRRLARELRVPQKLGGALLPLKISVQVEFRYENWEPRENILRTPGIDRNILNFKRYGVRRNVLDKEQMKRSALMGFLSLSLSGDIETLWDEDFRRAHRHWIPSQRVLEEYAKDPAF